MKIAAFSNVFDEKLFQYRACNIDGAFGYTEILQLFIINRN